MASCHSVYLQAFTELYPDLIGNLKSGVFDITDQAYSKFLISIDVKDEITSRTSGKTETERTRILLDAIQAKISESDVYYQFLEILQEDKAFNEVACKFEAKVQAQEEQKGSLSSAIETPRQNRHVNREYSILVHKKCQWNRYLQDSYTMNKFIRLLKRNGLLTKNQSRRSRKSFEQLFDCMLSLVKKDPSKLRSFTELLETITSEQLELESAVRCETELADQYTEPNGYHIHQARNNIKNKTYWKTLCTVFTVILFFAILIVYVFVPKNSNAGNDDGFILPNSTDRVDKGSIDVYKQTVSHNLPRRSSPFFGRENNLSRLTEILLKGNCIININGPPAFGKSSLAVKLGWNLIENHSGVFKEVRYIDVATTRMSIYLCSHHFESKRSTINPGSKEPNSVVALNDSESSGSSGSDTEPDICEWSKTRTYRSLLILDNCDFVLHESRRQEFIDFINSQLDRCHYGKLSLVITSQEQLNFLDNCFQNFPIAELDPTDSVNLLRHHIPNLNDEMAQQFSSLVGHCPLALKVIGRLLAARGIENMETLLNSLKEKAVSTISNRITDNKERFRTIMDVAYSNLDIENQECSLIVSFFQSSFDSEIGTTILSGIVNPDCVQDIVQKSFLEEYFVASKTRYTMHKLVRSYFQEVHINDSFYMKNRKKFLQNFIANYSDYLISIMKDRYKFKNITDEESHRFFYLEQKNVNFFAQELINSATAGIKLNENNVIALATLIIENISDSSDYLVKELAFTYFTDHSLYSKLCHFSSLDICSQFMWQLLVHEGIPLCIDSNPPPLFFYIRIFKYFMDEKQDCKIIACENLRYEGTLSRIIKQVKTTEDSEEKNLLTLLETALFLCQNEWMIKVCYPIYFALRELRLVMSIVMIGLTLLWLKTLHCFSFKKSVSLVRRHFMLCCFLYWLHHTRIPKQIPSETVHDQILLVLITATVLLLIMLILAYNIIMPKSIHHNRNLLELFTDIILTSDLFVTNVYGRNLNLLYVHLFLSLVVNFFLMFVSKEKTVNRSNEQWLWPKVLIDAVFCVVFITISYFLSPHFVHYVLNAIFYSISWLINPDDIETDIATY